MNVKEVSVLFLLSVLDDSEQPYGAQWDWQGINYIFKTNYDNENQKYASSDIRELPDVSLMHIMGMLIADILVYTLLALYFENVLPSEHGIRRPWYWFNFQECFKRMGMRFQRGPVSKEGTQVIPVDSQEPAQEEGAGEGAEADTTAGIVDTVTHMPEEEKANENETTTVVAKTTFEPEVGQNTPVGIEVQNIYKSFGKKQAVNGVSLSMYKGDIFALLGHNGAGKTTLISMLTGFFSPTSGTAIVDGHDIRNDMVKARKQMGLCPQHNMLFENISVSSQLVIFGMVSK